MNRFNYTDPENVAQTTADFTSLMQHPGWKLLEDIVQGNVEEIKQQLLLGTGQAEDMDLIKRLRDKINIHQAIIDTPKRTIKMLEPKNKPENFEDDPYLKLPDPTEEKLAEATKL